MLETVIAVAIIAVLGILFIVLFTLNRRIKKPDGCEELQNNACIGCSIVDSCNQKGEK